METLLTFTVLGRCGLSSGNKKMLEIKCVSLLEKQVFLVETIEGKQDVLVLKNPKASGTGVWNEAEYYVETPTTRYYFNLGL